MSVKAYRTYGPLEQQRTQATLYREDLAESRDSQAQHLTPRSEGAWGAEQQRLGSWRSGVGSFRPSGVGDMYRVGQGNYTPVGLSNYTVVGRADDVVDRQRDVAFASTSDEERSRWRALR